MSKMPDVGFVWAEQVRKHLQTYRDLGLAVIPAVYGDKRPEIDWKQWQKQAPPWDQVDKWFNDGKPHNVAIVCGEASRNLAVIDFDDPETYSRFFKVAELEKETLVVRTGSGRYHVYLFTQDPVPSFKIPQLKIEVRSTGNIVIAPPSKHPSGGYYAFVNPEIRTIVTVPDLVETVWKGAERLGVKKPVDVYSIAQDEAHEEPYRGPDPPCIAKLLEGVEHGIRNEAGIRIASHYLKFRGEKTEKVESILFSWNARNNPPLQETELHSVLSSASKMVRGYGCRLNQAWCNADRCPLKAAKPEGEVEYVPFKELPDGCLAEQGFDGREVYFLLYDPKSGKIERLPQIKVEDHIVRPIDNAEVRDRTVLFPSDILEYEDENKLMENVETYLNKWHEAPDPLSRKLDVFYCLLTYIKDLVPQLPYRRYLAPWGKGKSAWLETLGWACYRGMILAGSDTDKSVVRKIHNWQGTALIDEADFGDSTFYAFLVKILNIGYDRKTGFYHRSDENDPVKTLSYNVYGPKILSTRSKYRDLALESRCLTTIGRQNVNPIPLFRMEKFQQEALEIRNKLLLWRFRNYHRIKEKAVELEDPQIATRVYDGADNISSRVKQVILPLWLIGGDLMKDTLTNLAKAFDDRLKIEDPDYLLELEAKDAIKALSYGDEAKGVNVKNILNVVIEASSKESFYEIALSTISRQILTARGAEEDVIGVKEVTSISKSLKRVFETGLGFDIRIGKARKRVVLVPAKWVSEAEEQPKPSTTLEDILGDDFEKDVQNVHDVHPTHESNARLTESLTNSDTGKEPKL